MVVALNILHCFLIARICDFCILQFHYLCPAVSQQFCVPRLREITKQNTVLQETQLGSWQLMKKRRIICDKRLEWWFLTWGPQMP